ncbi:MAG: hypothetical protein HY273_14380 [Gammaproteobacteria bacterium]|nr:hypothetical protein [Gammaproteobacteria bacterium]
MTSNLPYLVPLAYAGDTAMFGGKAAALARMLTHGFRVPTGIVVSDAIFQMHLDQAGLRATVNALAANKADTALAEEIANCLLMTPINQKLLAALGDYSHAANNAVHAVRSSAIGEDSAKHSWAGQLDTVLNVTEVTAVEHALRTVWASAWSARSLVYQRRCGLHLAHMGVIVQRQVDARHAGVLFTHAPGASSDVPAMLIEYCTGLGDALVSGALDPARIRVARESGSTLEHVLPNITFAPLSAVEIDEIVAEASKLETVFGCPLDIEWAIDQAGVLWLLQARPITTPVIEAPDINNKIVWTNANIAENFPDPVSPFLYSVVRIGYAAYFRNLGLGFGISPRRIAAMEPALQSLVGVHGGRLYYNLSNIHALLHLAPAGRWLVQAFNAFVGVQENPVSRFPLPKQSFLDRVTEWLRIPIKTAGQYLTVQARVARFEAAVGQFCYRTRPSALENMQSTALLDQLRGFLDLRLRRWNDAALADTAAMICYGLLQRTLRRAWPEAGEGMHNNLLVGLHGLASHTPVEKLWALAQVVRADAKLTQLFAENDAATIHEKLAKEQMFSAFHNQFYDYLERWGFRSSGELMLTHASPQEDPAPTLALLKTYVKIGSDSPEAMLLKQAAARVAATEAVCTHLSPLRLVRALPWLSKAGRFRVLLSATQGAIRLRERARMQQARLYVRLRHLVQACGRRLVASGHLHDPDDAFQLTMDELQDLLGGQALYPYSVRALVQQRRQDHERLTRMTPPDNFVLAHGAYLSSTTAPETNATARASSTQLRGIGACGGAITATAAVLADATEIAHLREGDIVVTRQTDPGWACVFFLARGLVVERGGMLSHGAIIAREFGIPAVVGVSGATTRIRSGDGLSVNGDSGVVDIIR